MNKLKVFCKRLWVMLFHSAELKKINLLLEEVREMKKDVAEIKKTNKEPQKDPRGLW